MPARKTNSSTERTSILLSFHNGFWDYYGYGLGRSLQCNIERRRYQSPHRNKTFSLKEDKLLWSGITETKNPENPAKLLVKLRKNNEVSAERRIAPKEVTAPET
jgi:hypothetical protein